MNAKVKNACMQIKNVGPPEGAADLEERLRAAGVDATLTVHPGTGHAFMASHNALGTQDNELAARLWPEVHSFIRETLS